MSGEEMGKVKAHQGVEQRIHNHLDDEISLTDLLLVLVKRKLLIACIFVFCIVVGGVIVFTRPDLFEFSTPIEIGSIVQDEGAAVKVTMLEPAEQVRAKLESSYIPLVQTSQLEANQPIYELIVKVPKGSQIILLSSKGTKAEQTAHQTFHEQVISLLLDDHQRLLKVPKQSYELQLAEEQMMLERLEDPKFVEVQVGEFQTKIKQAEAKLQSLVDDAVLIDSRLGQLDKNKELLIDQIVETQSTIDAAKENRVKAIGEASTAAKAMTLLMIDNQIEQSRSRLALLKERLYIQLDDKKEQLIQQKQSNLRSQDLQKREIVELKTKLQKFYLDHQQSLNLQKQQIAKVKNQLDNLQSTRSLGVTMRSLNPVGAKKSLVLALAGMVGLMAGVLMAFVAEFVENVPRQQEAGQL